MAIIQKITTGFVVQNFDTETNKCVDQHFTAGDDVVWEDLTQEDDIVIDSPNDAEYFPYDMVQPNN